MSTQRLAVWAAALVAAIIPLSSGATIYYFDANLSGPAESPPNTSPGTGFAQVTFDNVANTMEVNVTFSGLTGTTTASHIHAATASPGTGTAGVATTTPTFTGFPLGVTSGTYDHVFDMTLASSYNSAFITANGGTTASAETALLNDMLADESYLNIHTTTFGGGEIRGFLVEVVPEPSTFGLCGLGLAGAAVLRLRRKCKS